VRPRPTIAKGCGSCNNWRTAPPESLQYCCAWAHQCIDLGQVYQSLDRFDQAEELYREAIRLCEERAGSYSPLRRELAYAYSRLGGLPGNLTNEEYPRKALELQEQVLGEAPEDPSAQFDVATSQHNLGLLYYRTGRVKQAEAPLRRAVQFWESLLHARPTARDARYNLGESCLVLAAVREGQDRAEAARLVEQAVASHEQLAQKFPTSWVYQGGLARARHILAGLYMTAHRLAEAANQEGKAVAYRERAAAGRPEGSQEHLNLAENLITLGMIQGANRQTDRAEATLQRAIGLAEAAVAHGPDADRAHLVLAEVLIDLGEVLRRAGRPADALPPCRRAIATLDGLHRKDPANSIFQGNLLNAHGVRATALSQLGRHAEAVADWDRIVELASEIDRAHYRVQRAVELVAAGDHIRAAAEAGALAAKPAPASEDLYSLSCVYARLVPSTDRDPQRSKAAAAVELLPRLEHAGYFKTAAARKRLAQDQDLQSLRQRPVFQALRSRVEATRP
jgi:tetratricopeptide (TPR) repeat protein